MLNRSNNYKNQSLFLRFCIVTFFSTLLLACYQPETACLDIEASNFDPSADEQCGSDDMVMNICPCEYPVWSLNLEHTFQDSAYKTDAIYEIDAQFIRIKSIRFYLSGFQFIQSNGEILQVTDTISLNVLNDNGNTENDIFTDDYNLIEQQTSIQIGSVAKSGQYDTLRFVVGVEGQINTANPNVINPTDHALADTSMHTRSQTNGYIFNQIIINKDTSSTTETELNIQGNSNLVEIKLPFSYKSTIGKDFSIGTLRIEHSKWFDGINFVANNEEIIIEKIITNTSSVFSLNK